MNVSTWAEKEIEIACARERAASENPDEWDYGVACYESALKAYKSLMDDGHSGPYWPRSKGYLLHGEDFLIDPANGDFDTLGYFYMTDPDGNKIEINRYFAEKGEGPMVEIDFEEYCERKKAAHDLRNVKGDE